LKRTQSLQTGLQVFDAPWRGVTAYWRIPSKICSSHNGVYSSI